jgi:hypothetical protein
MKQGLIILAHACQAGEDAALCSEPARCSAAGDVAFSASACHAITLPAAEPLQAALVAAGGNALLPQVLRFEVCAAMCTASLL